MSTLVTRILGLQPYEPTWQAMRSFTINRNAHSFDEVWFLEHPPTFTQGQAGKAEHVLNPNGIPVVKTDRGGQVTYHGPGQIISYLLIDLQRKQLGIRQFINIIENALIKLLQGYQIPAQSTNRPGIYINDQKIASIGLRVKKNCSYHGISLNVAMDLNPFSYINPCGYPGLTMTQVSEFSQCDMQQITQEFNYNIITALNYTNNLVKREKYA